MDSVDPGLERRLKGEGFAVETSPFKGISSGDVLNQLFVEPVFLIHFAAVDKARTGQHRRLTLSILEVFLLHKSADVYLAGVSCCVLPAVAQQVAHSLDQCSFPIMAFGTVEAKQHAVLHYAS